MSNRLVNKAAKIPVNKPIIKPVPVGILRTSRVVFLFRYIAIIAERGTTRQQAIFLIPGIVEITAAPNPQISAGVYL